MRRATTSVSGNDPRFRGLDERRAEILWQAAKDKLDLVNADLDEIAKIRHEYAGGSCTIEDVIEARNK